MPINSSKPGLFLGWDVGGTKSSAVVGTETGTVLRTLTWPSEASRGPEAMRRDFLDRLPELKNEFGSFKALGVSIGGPLDTNRGIIYSPPNLPGWDSIPLRDLLEQETGLPTYVEHDAMACLLAECFWGAAQCCRHAIYLTAGTGCGAGILIDGNPLRGPSGQTPEAGHIRIAKDGPVCFGKAGSIEAFCSGTGLSLLAPFLFPERFSDPVPARELVLLAEQKDVQAQEVLRVSAQKTGQACALLGDLFSPEVILIGSLARYLPEWWLVEVRESFLQEVLPGNGAHTLIQPAALGDRLQELSCLAPAIYGKR